MKLKNFFYIKKEILSRKLALAFSRTRALTPLQLILKTLKCNNFLPERLVALELFGFIGTSTTLDYAQLTDYLEIWELNADFAKVAQKNIPQAKVICGNSVDAIKTGKVLRKDYNFIVIDTNSSSAYDDGSYESFSVFPNALNYIADNAVIIVTIYTELNNYTKHYKRELNQNWIKARKDFFELENVINARGIDYLKGFEKQIILKNINIVQSQFFSRNDSVGFGVFVLKK